MSVYVYYYNDEMLYIGSTFNLKQRETVHKSKLKCGNTYQFYMYLREQGLKIDDLHKEIVETAIYERGPLKILEGMMIEYWKPKCNKNIPGRTRGERDLVNKEKIAEYYQDNKVKILEQNRQYKKANKVKILEQNKQYRLKKKQEKTN